MELKDRVQNSLDEARMLVLGAQMFIGFQFTATFQPRFTQLPALSQKANLAALVLMLITFALLLTPATFHQITMKGRDSKAVVRFTSALMAAALIPFSLSLGISVFIPSREIAGGLRSALLIAIIATILAFLFWYGPALLPQARRKKRQKAAEDDMKSLSDDKPAPTSPHDKIRQALTEARVILPGNQALLGFQLAVILQQRFRDIPPSLQYVHLASLLLVGLSTILLLTPAPYHRIVEHGDENERFYEVASRLVLASLPPLAAGICGDFFVVIYVMSQKWVTAGIAAAVMAILFATLWFAYPSFRRAHEPMLNQSV
jgi:hypothetical protein